MTELTKEQALKLCHSNWWVGRDDREIVKFQLWTERLCMPWTVFHEKASKVFGRPIFTHEFSSSNIESLRDEFLGKKPKPTVSEIFSLVNNILGTQR